MNYYTGVLQVWSRYHEYPDERFIARAASREDAEKIITHQRRAEVSEEYEINVIFDRSFWLD